MAQSPKWSLSMSFPPPKIQCNTTWSTILPIVSLWWKREIKRSQRGRNKISTRNNQNNKRPRVVSKIKVAQLTTRHSFRSRQCSCRRDACSRGNSWCEKKETVTCSKIKRQRNRIIGALSRLPSRPSENESRSRMVFSVSSDGSSQARRWLSGISRGLMKMSTRSTCSVIRKEDRRQGKRSKITMMSLMRITMSMTSFITCGRKHSPYPTNNHPWSIHIYFK